MGWDPQPATKTEIEYRYPPSEWLKERPMPVLSGDRNRDLVEYVLRLEMALRMCQGDKDSVRSWVEQAQSEEGE